MLAKTMGIVTSRGSRAVGTRFMGILFCSLECVLLSESEGNTANCCQSQKLVRADGFMFKTITNTYFIERIDLQ